MLLSSLLGASFVVSSLAKASRPNIVLILVDDQDTRQNSIATMKSVQKHLVEEGTRFSRFYAPTSVCCPSRTSLLRAQAAHNTNITHVIAPWGGWEVFNEKGYNGHYLPSFLQEAGFGTYYVGKLMNDYKASNFNLLPAQGWTDCDFLVDPNTYDYWNASFAKNNKEITYHPGEYSTDLVAAKALLALDQAATSPETPFFLGIAPIAPHSHIDSSVSDPRNIDVTLDYSRASHNPDTASGVSWVRRLEKLNVTNVAYIEEFYRQRLRALKAVDELVEDVVRKLEELGLLEDTFIIYTSDNGFEANGGHRRQPGKTLPYEEDINIPLVVRGPDVPRGFLDSESVYSLADLGATIIKLAGGTSDYENDGAILPLTRELRREIGVEGVKNHHLAEYWVQGASEGKYGSLTHISQTYRAVRVIEGTEINYSYAVWCTGEHELYDLNADPEEMENLAEAAGVTFLSSSRAAPLQVLQDRLDALLLVLKTCVGDVCVNPWKTLFPGGGVRSLFDAMEVQFDAYFASLPKVKYSYCDIGYHRKLEAPFWEEGLAFGAWKGLYMQNT